MSTVTRQQAARKSLAALALGVLSLALAAVPAAASSPASTITAAVDRDAGLLADLASPGTPRSARLVVRKSGFTRPVLVTNAGDCRLFVVEQRGLIKMVRPPGCHGATSWTTLATPFLDIRSLVRGEPGVDGAGSEEGLLGLAFHPGYATNGRFYVYYTNVNGHNEVVQGSRVTRDSGKRDRSILAILHPTYSNHNGGMIAFRSRDGMLYIGTGDGGGSGNPTESAQNRNSLLGKILRINVNTADTYSVPSDNPYRTSTNANQRLVWSYGLRNPWRWSFDRGGDNAMWIADVGQNRYEEVNYGGWGATFNYGWDVMEGRHCFEPSSGCNTTGLRRPKLEYSHGSTHCSVTGGYVYRGTDYPALQGRYFFADYCSGWLWNVAANSTAVTTLPAAYGTGRMISGFGEDRRGELYVVDHAGTILQIVD
jgi:hypothetical protein